MQNKRFIRRVSAIVMLGGLMTAGLGVFAAPASAADILPVGTVDTPPTLNVPCGQDGVGRWMRFTLGGVAKTYTRESTGQSPPGTLNFTQTADAPPKVRIDWFLADGGSAWFGEVILYDGGNNGSRFVLNPPVSSTGGNFLAPGAGVQNATHLFLCSYPENAAFTVKKVVSYPQGTVVEQNDSQSFVITVTCVAPGGSFNFASTKTVTLQHDDISGSILAPQGLTCTATDSDPRFTTTATTIVLDTTDNSTQQITVTNTKMPETRTLTVSKAVAGSIDGDPGSFPFTVTCSNPSSPAPAPASFSLATGASQVVVVPRYATCTVAESGNANFVTTVSGDDADGVNIPMNDNKSVLFTNTRRIASLTITKVQQLGAPSDQFDFSVACAGVTKTGSRAGAGDVVITGLPTAVPCTVTEATLANYITTPSLSQPITLTQAGPNVVTFTNARRVGSLTISKVRNGGDDDTFTFNYACGASTGTTTLKGGASSTVLTNIPTGTSCTVTEVPDARYATAVSVSQPMTIAEGSNPVTFTNTRKVAGLTIAKTRLGGSMTDSFTFNYNCGTGFTGTVTLTPTNGSASTNVASIPTGSSCSLTETPDDRYTTESTTLPVAIGADGGVVTFTNVRKTGTIVITKVREGGSSDDAFNFLAACVGFGSDAASITGSGTTTIIAGVPTGTSCTVSESPDARYVTTASVVQPMIVGLGKNEVTFTNTFVVTDLGIDKSAPEAISAGQELVYSIIGTNHSATIAAASPTLTDTVPSGTTFVSLVGPAGWTCTTPAVGGTGAINCGAASLAAGASANFTLRVAVPAGTAAGTFLSNTASVSSSTPEPADDPHPNTDTVRTEVVTEAALTITKTTSSSSVTPDGFVTFLVSVTNNGPSVAQSVIVTDPVPPGLTYVTPGDPSCNAAGTMCDLGTLTVDQSKSVSLTYKVPIDYALANLITNVATATSPTDPTPVSATAFVQLARLTVEKRVAATPAPPIGGYESGDVVTFEIIVRNTGGATLTSTKVAELVAGVTVTACTTGDMLAPVVAAGYTLLPGGQLLCTATYSLTLADINAGRFTNTATGDSAETNLSTASLTITLPGNPSILATKTETSTGPYGLDSTITFEIEVSNNGTVTLHSLDLVEQVGATLVDCTVPDELAPGASFTCTAEHDVTAGDLDAGEYENVATASGVPDSGEPVTDEATATVALPSADLSVSKALIGAISIGGTATYSLVVTNAGPSAATGVKVTDQAVSGLALSSASGDGWICSTTPGEVVCTTDATVAVGQTLPTITVIASITAASGATVQNLATVGSDQLDPNLTNNQSSVLTSANVVLDEVAIPNQPVDFVLPGTGAPARLMLLLGLLLTLFGALMSIATTVPTLVRRADLRR